MDLLLVNLYMLALDAEEQRLMRPHPPLGLLYLVAPEGARCGRGDLRRHVPIDGGLRRIPRPRATGRRGHCRHNLMTKRNALKMIGLAKARGSRVVVGGPDPPHHAAAYLDAGADVVVVGEGEHTLEELLPILLARRPVRRSLDEGGSLGEGGATIHGIVFKAPDGTVVRTPPRAQIPDLDCQPFPDRSAIDLPAYLHAWRGAMASAPCR